jgi:Methyltransferase domain
MVAVEARTLMGKLKRRPAPTLAIVPPLKINLGSGKSKMDGFLGVDSIKFENVDIVADLRKRWPWADDSVDEANCSHFLEHLDSLERVHFFNELYRVLKVGAKCTLVTPHWASCRAYGDPTHKWPPVSEFAFYYLLKAWRDGNAPHTDAQHVPGMFNCDFDAAWGFGMRNDLLQRNQEYQQYALANYKEAAQDTVCTLTKRGS